MRSMQIRLNNEKTMNSFQCHSGSQPNIRNKIVKIETNNCITISTLLEEFNTVKNNSLIQDNIFTPQRNLCLFLSMQTKATVNGEGLI